MESVTAMRLSHLSHIHPLTQFQVRIDQDSTCAGCNTQLLTGPGADPYFACQLCCFYLHKRCALAPISKRFSSVHSKHQLSLGFEASRSGKHCDVCRVRSGKTYIVGLFYECRACNFDAHITCVAPWRDNSTALHHFAHFHPLELLKDEIRHESTCAGCKSKFFPGSAAPPLFGCKECEFYLHFQCAAAPSSKHFPSVHRGHALTLGFKPARSMNYCDVCHERGAASNKDKYIVGLFYECRACNFDVHISCVQPPSVEMPSKFRNLNINSSNSAELLQDKDGILTAPPSCHNCKSTKQFPEVADEVLDLMRQAAQSSNDPDEYQELLQHFKDTFPKADGNAISAVAMHLRYPSNQKVYKSMMGDKSTICSYIRRFLDPRSAPPINMSFLYSSSPTEDQIVTGRPVR